jgi:LemA protein
LIEVKQLNTFLFLLMVTMAITAIIYNGLKTRAESVKSSRANIPAVTHKRADLAQWLADIAKSYGDHEKLS